MLSFVNILKTCEIGHSKKSLYMKDVNIRMRGNSMGINLNGKMLDLFKKCDTNHNGKIDGGDWTNQNVEGGITYEQRYANSLLTSLFQYSDYAPTDAAGNATNFKEYSQEEFAQVVSKYNNEYDTSIDDLLDTAKQNAEIYMEEKKKRPSLELQQQEEDAKTNAQWEEIQRQQDAAEGKTQT